MLQNYNLSKHKIIFLHICDGKKIDTGIVVDISIFCT